MFDGSVMERVDSSGYLGLVIVDLTKFLGFVSFRDHIGNKIVVLD